MTIDQILIPVHDAFQAFAVEYDRCTRGGEPHTATPLLDEVEDYLSQHPGKRLRPLMVLLSAQACGHLLPHHVLVATAMEMLHNATLMHDDVVDESDSRRGGDSVRKRWSNQVAVLCGDFYLSQVMELLYRVGDKEASRLVANTVATMSRGELQQLYWTAEHGVTQEIYMEVIGCKTASLMATCCELGAMSLTDATAPYRQALHDFGYNYGLAFQMLDDLADDQTIHDIHMPGSSSPQELIAHHRQLATEALLTLPLSPAREALESMLNA